MDDSAFNISGRPRQVSDRTAETRDGVQGSARERPGLPEWEAAVASGARCLNPTSARYRVQARNPARAALAALKRHGVTGEQARARGLCIAIHMLPDTTHPRAVYALAGTVGSPMLRLRYARLLPGTSDLLSGKESPFDAVAVAREVPKTARRWAQARVGSSGVTEVLRGTFWQREATLYCSTALVLSALGFPMSAEVFAVGGILLMMQGAVRLIAHESRILTMTRSFLRNPVHTGHLHQDSQRMLFLRGHDLLGPTGRQVRRVLRERAAVPDLTGASRLMLLIDEDAAVTTGAGAYGIVPEETLPESDNVLTVVFRRPRKPAPETPVASADAMGPATPAQPAAELQPVDTYRVSALPARRSDVAPDLEDVEVIEAELLDPEAYFGQRPQRDWWV
jgi:hypothetical protein